MVAQQPHQCPSTLQTADSVSLSQLGGGVSISEPRYLNVLGGVLPGSSGGRVSWWGVARGVASVETLLVPRLPLVSIVRCFIKRRSDYPRESRSSCWWTEVLSTPKRWRRSATTWAGKARIRFKGNTWIWRAGKGWRQLKTFPLQRGEALCLHNVKLHKIECDGPVNVAIGYNNVNGEFWAIVRDEPTNLQTFQEYGLRFDIEEAFLDDQSNGWNLQKSEVRSVCALSRLGVENGVASIPSHSKPYMKVSLHTAPSLTAPLLRIQLWLSSKAVFSS
jgi:hypothetical protein